MTLKKPQRIILLDDSDLERREEQKQNKKEKLRELQIKRQAKTSALLEIWTRRLKRAKRMVGKLTKRSKYYSEILKEAR